LCTRTSINRISQFSKHPKGGCSSCGTIQTQNEKTKKEGCIQKKMVKVEGKANGNENNNNNNKIGRIGIRRP
jgi:hypothetical protein